MITTKRLHLLPLSYERLIMYMNCDFSLETELGLQHHARSISPELDEALRETILPSVQDDANNHLYHTLWTAFTRDTRIMVGDLFIVGAPNEKGEIGIGYGTYREFQGLGYMSEIVQGIISWAETQSEIKAIVANTTVDNIASLKVLEKNQFVNIKTEGEKSFWVRKLRM